MENKNIKRKENNKKTVNKTKNIKKNPKNRAQGKVVEVSLGKILKKAIILAIIIYGLIWVYNNRDGLKNGYMGTNNNSNLINESSNFNSNNSEFSDLNIKDENEVFALYANDYIGVWQKYYIDQSMPDYELNIISIEDKKVTFNINYHRIAQFKNQTAELDGNTATFDTILNDESSNWIISGKLTFSNNKIRLEITKSEFEDLVPRETIDFELKTNESKLE